MSATAITERCANCGTQIGRLQQAFVWKDQPVCGACFKILREEKILAAQTVKPVVQSMPAQIKSGPTGEPIRALGITRGVAWAVGILGLLLSPAIIGIPIAIWGFAADYMIVQEEKRRGLR